MRATFVAVLALAISVSAAPSPFGRGRFGNQGFGHGFGNQQQGNGNGRGGNNGNNGAAASSAAVAASSAAVSTDSAAAAASSVAATASAAAATASAANSTAAVDNSTGAANTTATATSGSNSTDIQSSLTLDPSVIATGFADDGQDVPAAGQVASLTSTNNFINFCAGQTITNGQQITTGSCNPAPMGQIAAQTSMPSAKFIFPKNFDNTSIKANTAFTVQVAFNNLETGNFVNAEENYFAAPQQVNAQGQIIGHSHIVIEHLDTIGQTAPTDPQTFAFFKGLNTAAVNGVISQSVDQGLPGGVYKISTINTAANHQPALVAVAQHGSLDDAVYFTITD